MSIWKLSRTGSRNKIADTGIWSMDFLIDGTRCKYNQWTSQIVEQGDTWTMHHHGIVNGLVNRWNKMYASYMINGVVVRVGGTTYDQ